MQMRNWFILFVIAAVFSSCTDPVYYEKSYSFPKNTWNLKVRPMFKVEITDTSKLYDFTITLRTTTDYAFNNCWIYLNTKTPNKIKAREPFEIKITNPDGTWIGKKSGTIVEHMLSFKRRKFPLKGAYFFELEQAVAQENLDEVLDIGIRIEEAK